MPTNTIEFERVLARNVLEEPVLASMIKTNFYPAYMFARKEVKYPCVNYWLTGGTVDRQAIGFVKISINIVVFSQKHFKEAWLIFEALSALLNHKNFTGDNIVSQMFLLDYPEEIYVSDLPAFSLPSAWEANITSLAPAYEIEIGGITLRPAAWHLHKYSDPLTGVIDGVNTVFTTVASFKVDTVEIFKNGLEQYRPTDFTLTLPNVITLAEAPLPGDILWANYHRA